MKSGEVQKNVWAREEYQAHMRASIWMSLPSIYSNVKGKIAVWQQVLCAMLWHWMQLEGRGGGCACRYDERFYGLPAEAWIMP